MKLNYQKIRSKRGWRPGYCRISLKPVRKNKYYKRKKSSYSNNYADSSCTKYNYFSKLQSDVYDYNGKLFDAVKYARREGYATDNNERINCIIAEGEKRFSKYGYVYDGNKFSFDKTKVNRGNKQDIVETQVRKSNQAIIFFDSEEDE